MTRARGAGVLGALADGRCRIGDAMGLPPGMRIAIAAACDAERGGWSRALIDAGARVSVIDGETWPRDVDLVILADPDGRSPDLLGAHPCLAVCDHLRPERVSAMLRAGVLDLLVRPVSPADLVEACRHAVPRLRGRPMRRSARTTHLPIEGVTGAALARTRLPILLLGETGTGKSRMARKLHDTLTPGAPFIEVNAAGLASNLVTSELFGHERGAFTGAHASKQGLAALADGGTLFLDEIGDLAADAQAQLLSFLDTGAYRPVGGVREVRSDARIVCATNRDLAALVAASRFRDDLYYRLASIVVPLAPLRDDPSRIPGLVAELARQAAARAGLADPAFGDDALELLAEQPWRGNVRELRFVVERIVATSDERPITAAAVAPFLVDLERTAPAGSPPAEVRSLAEMERDLVERAMRQTGGNRTRAAELLGITPRGLYNKLRRHGTTFRSSE